MRRVKSGSDIWVCRVCRSINPIRSGRCYSCNTPIEVAAAKPEDLTVARSDAQPVTVPTGTFRSSETRAALVSIAVIAFMLASLVALWVTLSAINLRADGERAAANDLLSDR